MQLSVDLMKNVYFFNIGPHMYDAETFYEWKSKTSLRASFFDIKLTRNAPYKNIFYCLTKEDLKLVYYAKRDVVFTIGANPEIQSPLLEAVIEYLYDNFFEMYDESMLTTCYGDICNIFDGFKTMVEDTFKNYNNLNLITTALVICKGCDKTLPFVIKNSLVENATTPTTPIVYNHAGHSLLIYIDKQYKVRGSQLVSVSY